MGRANKGPRRAVLSRLRPQDEAALAAWKRHLDAAAARPTRITNSDAVAAAVQLAATIARGSLNIMRPGEAQPVGPAGLIETLALPGREGPHP